MHLSTLHVQMHKPACAFWGQPWRIHRAGYTAHASKMFPTWVQEGELRPQLLDRFGMSVNVTTLLDVDVRTQMVLDKMAYEQVRLLHTPARHFLHSNCCAASIVHPGFADHYDLWVLVSRLL